jgi:hypothetical protein
MMKKLLILAFGLLLTLNFSLVWAQECSNCNDPDDATNCGDPACDFACPNCSNSLPPAPDVPVDNGIGILIALGIGLTGLVVYQSYQNKAKQVQS